MRPRASASRSGERPAAAHAASSGPVVKSKVGGRPGAPGGSRKGERRRPPGGALESLGRRQAAGSGGERLAGNCAGGVRTSSAGSSDSFPETPPDWRPPRALRGRQGEKEFGRRTLRPVSAPPSMATETRPRRATARACDPTVSENRSCNARFISRSGTLDARRRPRHDERHGAAPESRVAVRQWRRRALAAARGGGALRPTRLPLRRSPPWSNLLSRHPLNG